MTPIHYASRSGHLDAMKLLVSLGAKYDVPTNVSVCAKKELVIWLSQTIEWNRKQTFCLCVFSLFVWWYDLILAFFCPTLSKTLNYICLVESINPPRGCQRWAYGCYEIPGWTRSQIQWKRICKFHEVMSCILHLLSPCACLYWFHIYIYTHCTRAYHTSLSLSFVILFVLNLFHFIFLFTHALELFWMCRMIVHLCIMLPTGAKWRQWNTS